MVEQYRNMVGLFVVEHANEVFGVLEDIQVSVAATFVPSKHPRRAKPIMHSVYNMQHNVHSLLQHFAESYSLRSGTESQLTNKNQSGKFKYDVSLWRDQFLDVVKDASKKIVEVRRKARGASQTSTYFGPYPDWSTP